MNEQLDRIEAKLDRLLRLLEPPDMPRCACGQLGHQGGPRCFDLVFKGTHELPKPAVEPGEFA